MARSLRYLPRPGAVVELTQRTFQGRLLLQPSPRLNDLVAGCLARAQKNTGATVYAVAVLSNHFHVLASFETVEQMAQFACQLKTNLSKEMGRLHDWEGSLFAGRYRSVPLSDEPEIQIKRLKYLLSQGAKEGLVLSPRDWPGVHCVDALLKGEPIRGVWVDRTKLYSARQRGAQVTEAQFTETEELHLSPLPCWAELAADERQREVVGLVEMIESQTLERHRREGTVPLGAGAICRRKPQERSARLVKSPKPYFHATRQAFRALMDGLREFTIAYRSAAERLASGDRGAVFPENCFPPRLPFVPPATGPRAVAAFS